MNIPQFVDQLNGNLNYLFLPLFKFGDSMYLALITKEVQEIRGIFATFEIQLNRLSGPAHEESIKYIKQQEEEFDRLPTEQTERHKSKSKTKLPSHTIDIQDQL